ncbi:flavin reductase family protein [Rhodobacter sp. 24-YEA-8]|uniref:flavin reductase family protein n=1 Tax=Rhodobacter sp. 24-YEA-8 TaxID=1884310 RepID=UPI00089BCC19|nr:flavin reductase family protein [Rhodobacter sp. 24-YEA-8]SED87974.1 NADH-FMN oxidoreductase RutF, flavin reductase (DIM6/NTAB) family [Rhodobacter sp. 24-YEA-8]
MSPYHSYDPDKGHGLPHDPLRAIVAPRPVGWIPTLGTDGRANLAPYSFFNIFSYDPPILIFGSIGEKDTFRNAIASGEFVCNIASLALAPAMAQSAWPYPPEVDEFEALGLAKQASDLVAAPRLRDAPVALECRVVDSQRLRDLSGHELESRIVIGQVLRIHIRQEHLVDGIYDLSRTRPVARCGYAGDYIATERLFDLRARDPATPLPPFPHTTTVT